MNNTLKTIFLIVVLVVLSRVTSGQNSSKIEMIPDSICIELARIYGLDQGIRQPDVFNAISRDLLLHFDSVNYANMLEIVEKYNYPTQSRIPKAYKYEAVEAAAFCIFTHSPHRNIENKEFFIAQYKMGYVSNNLLALLFDRYYVHYKHFSPYASQYRQFLRNPLMDKSKKALSDSLRNELDLPPLGTEYYK